MDETQYETIFLSIKKKNDTQNCQLISISTEHKELTISRKNFNGKNFRKKSSKFSNIKLN